MLLLILQRKKRAVKYAACLVAFAQNTIFTPLLKSRVTDRRNTFLPQKVCIFKAQLKQPQFRCCWRDY